MQVENDFDELNFAHQPYYARLTSQKELQLNNCVRVLRDSAQNNPIERRKVSELEQLVTDMEKTIPGNDYTGINSRYNPLERDVAEIQVNIIISKTNELLNEEVHSLNVWINSSMDARRNAIADSFYTGIAAIVFIFVILIRLNRGIARRKLAEKKIRESERHLRKMIEEVGDVIYSSDFNGCFTFINARLESLTGYTTGELIGKNFVSLVHPDWSEKVKEFYHHQFTNKLYETRFEFPIVTKQGQTKWVEQNVVMASRGKMVEGFQCVVRDITRRKEAEEQIRRTNQFLDSMLENIPNTIFVKDAKDLSYIRFNKAGEKLMGRSSEELKGKTDYDLFPKEQADFFTKNDREVLKGRKGIDIPEEPVNAHNGLRWVHTQKIPIYDNLGAPLYILGISEDITEKKKIEDQLKESQPFYRTIAHNFPDGSIAVLGRDLVYQFADGRELVREGLTPEDLVGTYYLTRFPEEERNEVQYRLSAIFRGEETSFEATLSGNYYIIHGAPLRTENNRVTEILLVKQNINKLKLAEENMKAALEKEKLINELKSRFVSLASHEFRTPLSTILSSTELIGEYIEHDGKNQALIKDKNIQHLKRIKSAIQNMVNILNNFLSLDQLEQGKTLTNPMQFDIKKFAEEMIDELQGILKKGQKIAYSHQTTATAVYMDKSILANVTSNLLTNALKYSPEDSTINFTTFVTSNGLEFMVEDHGIGIPQTEQANLFERFFRAKNTLNIEGTGLGLSIVKKYIDLLNGHISFTSRENEGSIFKVFIANAARQTAPENKT